ncbi:MAG: tetratricopeptide repeat protein [Verrucomicrobiota bacterium]
MRIKYSGTALIALAVFFCRADIYGQQAEPAKGDSGSEQGGDSALSPLELLKRGRAAFQKNDFMAAELAFGQFFSDYGENPEAEEALRIHRPFFALSKVGVKSYAEALPLIEESLKDGKLKEKLADELGFWRPICLMQAGELVAAQEGFGEYWSNEKHEVFKRYEALLLFAGLYLMQDFDKAAADFLKDQIPKMRKRAPEAAGRAVVLRLHALIKAGEDDQALHLVQAESVEIKNITQVVSFQLLALQLGVDFLEQKQYRKSIICLQRVWPKAKLLKYQQERLIKLRLREHKLSQQQGRQAVLFQIKAIIRRVEREVGQLEQMENFDSGLRLRLAIAFQSQERYREAALVMGAMLKKMPADSVVDSASLAQMQCWAQIERWPKVVEVADLYLKRFGSWEEAKYLPQALFLKAEAFRQEHNNRQAARAYGELAERFPKNEQAPAALFMQAYMYLVQDDSEGAVYHFDQLRQRYPQHLLNDDADYWTAMSWSFSSEYEKAKLGLERYLNRHGKAGKYWIEAEFRLAYCVFALGDNVLASDLFAAFISQHKNHVLLDEARLLLGDAYLGEGRIDEGTRVYRKINPKSKRFFEDGWFKIGKALRLTDQLDQMRSHFEGFLQSYPDSRRMPEAIYWIGWVDRQNGELERAKEVYWQVLTTHGNKARLLAIEDLIAALPKLYRDTGEQGDRGLLGKFDQLKKMAQQKKQRVLSLRCSWGMAQVHRGRDVKSYRVALLAATTEVDGKVDQPRITVDCADAQLAMGNHTLARDLYQTVKKWHPGAVERDRIFSGLGKIAEANDENKRALYYYERAEKSTASTTLMSQLKLDRARLLAGFGRSDEAQEVLQELLENPIVSSRSKALALFASGELLMDQQQSLKAAAYYERIYVVYGKFGELVARAYWRRGEALEKMTKPREAEEVYAELTSRDNLKSFAEFDLATERLEKLRLEKGEL